MTSYETTQNKMFRISDNGERQLLCNFEAEISKEVRYVDGKNSETILTITGRCQNPKNNDEPIEFQPVEIEASQFAGLQWIMAAWGVHAIVYPGSGIKDDLRTAIQLRSKPETKTIYKHIGWTKLDGKPAYLHSSGAIKAAGNDPSISVSLPSELKNYCLSCSGIDTKAAILATLQLADIAPKPTSWPLLAATFVPIFGPTDFAIHVTGRTGTFKSELLSIFQSHYGQKMDARHLPGSWSSTANALEAQAYYAANAAFVIDDFVPTGTSWQMRSYQTNADKIIRAQGNQSGRARLTDTSNLQTAMYPRGIVFSTGEDTPEGHSVRGRMLILELSPGDIEIATLSQAQKNRPLYPATTAALIQHLCQYPTDITPMANQIRDEHLDIGHSRTPATIGRLIAAMSNVLAWAQAVGAISQQNALNLQRDAEKSILAAGNRQSYYLEAADPCDIFCAAIRHIFASGLGHVRTVNGGIPGSPTILGWTEENSLGDVPTYKSHGPCIGWVSWHDDELFIEINTGYNTIKKVAGSEMTLSKQTMLRRLKDAALLTRTDDARQRNTVRITAESHPRQVLTMPLSTVLENQEKPNG